MTDITLAKGMFGGYELVKANEGYICIFEAPGIVDDSFVVPVNHLDSPSRHGWLKFKRLDDSSFQLIAVSNGDSSILPKSLVE